MKTTTTGAIFKADIATRPLASDLRLIYADWLEDQGEIELAKHQRLIAQCLTDWPRVRAKFSLKRSTQVKVRKRANAAYCPVAVVNGGRSPFPIGKRGRNKLLGSHRWRSGVSSEYVHSTFRVEVGILWLIAHGWI
jgi:uncharacterized protein (TIGR02996 family)